jgi:iron complex outermembrane receptor protein
MKKILLHFILWSTPLLGWGQLSITGTVAQKSTEKPITSAKIILNETGQETAVNQAGSFSFNDLKPGKYNLAISAEGYLSMVRSVTIENQGVNMGVRLIPLKTVVDEVLITSIRATEKTATTYSSLDQEEIEKLNFAQDIPFILNQLPSAVVTSDAGAGVGYTGIRIRGSDPTRTNVTINGIPLNDAEAHGVFWVNMPDFASSIDNIQVQRGVGTSTNGAAAFGASINIQTTTLNYEPYADISNSYGSFNTWRNTVSVGTGLMKEKFSIDARLSNITSDGWVDRAFSDMQSYYISAGYYGKKSLLKLNVFAGQEQTYQSWWGVPESFLENEELRRSNYYTYDNETDNYSQSHYQLLYSVEPTESLNLNLAAHYTKGSGYFEQFRDQESLSDYGAPDLFLINNSDTITTTDLIRRRWLDNDFYGFTYSANYTPNEKLQLSLGGGWNQYDGDHFGEVIWAQYAGELDIRDRYYDNRGLKNDFNTYLKGTYQITPNLFTYIDLQVRNIDYRFGDSTLQNPALDNDQQLILGAENYTFFNPKVGLTYQINPNQNVYASFSIGNREPVRSDFIDAPDGRTPLPEELRNLEVGYRFNGKRVSGSVNYYLMDYTNQLVLNGELNDVGASVRQNVADSYRTGIELIGQVELVPNRLLLGANLTLSQNKIAEFEEIIYNYVPFEVETILHENTDIAFSPNVIAGGTLTLRPVNNLDINLVSKYVGRQYLDNTSNDSRALDAFWVNDLRINYVIKPAWAKEIRFGLLVNNLFNEMYEPNGYTFSYRLGAELITENFYYPQAGTNFLANIAFRF